MTSAILQFLAAAAVIVVAGTYLARCADTIAEVTKLGRLLIGSVLLAGATSLPELTVDITAVRMSMPDLAVGDLLGSSLMNLLILAILDLLYREKGKMFSRSAAAHALSGTMSIAMTALAGLAVLSAPFLPDGTLLNLSLASWLIGVSYCLGVRTVYLDQRISAHSAAEAVQQAEQPVPEFAPAELQTTLPPLWKPVLGFLIAAAVIVVAGPQLAEAAGEIAELSGLGKTFVGTTLVAMSTSLPELVASIAALRLGAIDLAIGNVFGSNTFNMLLLVPLDALDSGSIFRTVSGSHIISCMGAILATSVAVMGQLYHVEKRWRLIEPDALLMLVIIGGALVLVYWTSSVHAV